MTGRVGYVLLAGLAVCLIVSSLSIVLSAMFTLGIIMIIIAVVWAVLDWRYEWTPPPTGGVRRLNPHQVLLAEARRICNQELTTALGNRRLPTTVREQLLRLQHFEDGSLELKARLEAEGFTVASQLDSIFVAAASLLTHAQLEEYLPRFSVLLQLYWNIEGERPMTEADNPLVRVFSQATA